MIAPRASRPYHRKGVGAMFNLGHGEITILVLLGVMFFGPRRLPELFRGTPLVLQRAARRLPDWSTQEWLLVVTPVLLVATAVAQFFLRG